MTVRASHAGAGKVCNSSGIARAGGAPRFHALNDAIPDSVGDIVGSYRWQPDGPDAGTFVLARKRAAYGRWLIYADIDNSNT